MLSMSTMINSTILILLVSLLNNRKTTISLLLTLELLASVLIITLFMMSFYSPLSNFNIMVMTPIMVSEAAIGLALLTNMMNSHGSQTLKSASCMKW